jgi:hypothetical protein
MTVAEMQDSAAEAFALVRGLGSTVGAVGLSLGGSMALWLAQTQTVDLAVSIAPFLMPVAPLPSKPAIPPLVGEPAMRVLAAIPSMYWGWGPRVTEGSRPPYAYPGHPTHALARRGTTSSIRRPIRSPAQPSIPSSKRSSSEEDAKRSAERDSPELGLLQRASGVHLPRRAVHDAAFDEVAPQHVLEPRQHGERLRFELRRQRVDALPVVAQDREQPVVPASFGTIVRHATGFRGRRTVSRRKWTH